MKQLWKIEDIQEKIDKKINKDLDIISESIYNQCLSFALLARGAHSYKNYKGELQSSVGVVILKDRKEVKNWSSVSSDGTDPAKGISDFNEVLNGYIIGHESLPDGTYIPSKSVVGIVFAAAPYAGDVESGKGMGSWGFKGTPKTVLNAFAPKSGYIYTILKSIISHE